MGVHVVNNGQAEVKNPLGLNPRIERIKETLQPGTVVKVLEQLDAPGLSPSFLNIESQKTRTNRYYRVEKLFSNYILLSSNGNRKRGITYYDFIRFGRLI
jgi:hypothetical protein